MFTIDIKPNYLGKKSPAKKEAGEVDEKKNLYIYIFV